MISGQEVRDVREPPGRAVGKVVELWKPVPGTNKIMCTACARYCKIGEGQVGLCGVRGVHEGKLWLYVYGRVITGHVDPIEKKPVSHYRPGSKIFSIATTGCNWLCHPAGTQILLTDGTTKPVEEVRPGDQLLSLASWRRDAVPDVVTEIGYRAAASFRVQVKGVRGGLLATAEHPILTQRGWVPVASLRPGDLAVVSGELKSSSRLANRGLRIPAHSLGVHPLETAQFLRAFEQETLSPSLRWAEVVRIVPEGGRERVYSFECVPFHNYVADSVVVHNCRYCFLPGTMVLTDQGHLPIEEVFTNGE